MSPGWSYAYKVAGAAAELGHDLPAVEALARRTVDGTRTMGVGLSPTILPAAGRPTFVLDDGEVEVGIGIHGEPGILRTRTETADEIAARLVVAVADDLRLKPRDRVAVLVNGLGATPLEELYVLYRCAARLLTDRGVAVHRSYVGEYATSLEMAGASISVLRLDDELEPLLDAPASSPFFVQA